MARRVRFQGYSPEDWSIIQKTPVDKVLEKFGIDVAGWRYSAGYICLCPFHPESSPSFAIQNDGADKGKWNCYHDPDSKGDLFDFVAQIKEISRSEAKELLVEWFQIDAATAPDAEELLELLKPEKTKKERCLPRIPLPRSRVEIEPIVEYLQNDPSRSKMGYSRKEIEAVVHRWGLRWADKGYYRGRIIVPIFDAAGRQVYFQAHAVDKEAIRGLPDPQNKQKLYPSKAPVLYHLNGIHKVTTDYVIVVEGFWDMVALDYWGFPSVMAGSAKLSGHQMALLIERFRRVWIWFDNDTKNKQNTGLTAAKKVCKELCQNDVRTFLVEAPPGDPDEVGGRDQARKILKENSTEYVLSFAPDADDLLGQLRA